MVDNLTIKLIEAIKKGEQIALYNKQQLLEPCHILRGMLTTDDNIIPFILKENKIDIEQLKGLLDKIILSQPKASGGNERVVFSKTSENVLNKSNTIISEFGDTFVSLDTFFLAIYDVESTTSRLLNDMGLKRIDIVNAIKKSRNGEKINSPHAESTLNSLELYARNLNKLARENKLDPVIGRDAEIRRILQTLSRRKKNNPIIIGEAGVGKTAIVEGLAHRIVSGDIPNNLKNKVIYELQMSSLIAGAMYKGQFEERLKAVVEEVTKNPEVILFIDEIHTLVGAGGGSGAMDAANILKPALSRGDLRVIGATTIDEYQKNIEKDKALERRFQKIIVEQPDTLESISILRGLKDKYEQHHQVRISDDAIIAAVNLSDRYITDRFLPDKAIDLLDEACAKMKLEINSVPEEIDEINRQLNRVKIEIEGIKRDTENKQKLEELQKELKNLEEEKNSITIKWGKEKEIVNKIQDIKTKIENSRIEMKTAEKESNFGRVAEIQYGVIPENEKLLVDLNNQLIELHKTSVLINEEVTANNIAEIISKWINIPVSKMLQTDKDKLIHLEDELHKRVIGQEPAISALSNAIRRARSGVDDGKKPSSFIFLGTTGVGKTELAKALAEVLFADENAILRIDMSEYQERHTVSRLIGAPPGYVGYDESGEFDKIRRNPYCIVLLDEFEKAHPDVFNILLQIFDEGRLTDNKGRVINFKNTIIIMTSNLGSNLIRDALANVTDENREAKIKVAEAEVLALLKQYLRPELLNRIDQSIVFEPLSKSQIKDIVNLQLKQLSKRLNLNFSENIINFVSKEGYIPEYGARPIKRLIQERILNELSLKYISDEVSKDKIVYVDYIDDKVTFKN